MLSRWRWWLTHLLLLKSGRSIGRRAPAPSSATSTPSLVETKPRASPPAKGTKGVPTSATAAATSASETSASSSATAATKSSFMPRFETDIADYGGLALRLTVSLPTTVETCRRKRPVPIRKRSVLSTPAGAAPTTAAIASASTPTSLSIVGRRLLLPL